MNREERVKKENEWIEQEFDCNITTPFITTEELELMEAGFQVNKEIPEDHVPLPDEVVERAIRKANNLPEPPVDTSGDEPDYGKTLYQQPDP